MPNYENTDTQLLEAIAIAAHHQLIAWDIAEGEPRLPAWHDATPEQQESMRRNVRDLLLGAKPVEPRFTLFGETVREMAQHFHISEAPAPSDLEARARRKAELDDAELSERLTHLHPER